MPVAAGVEMVPVPFTRTDNVVQPPSAEQTLVVPDPALTPEMFTTLPLIVAVRLLDVLMVL